MGGTRWQRNTSGDASNLTALEPECERRPGFRAIGIAGAKLAAAIITKRGDGILVRLKADWAAIVGPSWATVTWPIALGRDGSLKLRTASSTALDLQHRAPLLIERINLFFGRPAVIRLALVQGPLPLGSPMMAPILRPLTSREAKVLDEQLSAIVEPELRDALARLGRAVIAEQH
jgi:hypothetical protein